jgi:WD40 repeat protein
MSAPHLTLIHTLFAHKKLIQCVAWHPESTAVDTTYSPYRHWLAVASNETHIKVFDLSQLTEGKLEVVLYSTLRYRTEIAIPKHNFIFTSNCSSIFNVIRLLGKIGYVVVVVFICY